MSVVPCGRAKRPLAGAAGSRWSSGSGRVPGAPPTELAERPVAPPEAPGSSPLQLPALGLESPVPQYGLGRLVPGCSHLAFPNTVPLPPRARVRRHTQWVQACSSFPGPLLSLPLRCSGALKAFVCLARKESGWRGRVSLLPRVCASPGTLGVQSQACGSPSPLRSAGCWRGPVRSMFRSDPGVRGEGQAVGPARGRGWLSISFSAKADRASGHRY